MQPVSRASWPVRASPPSRASPRRRAAPSPQAGHRSHRIVPCETEPVVVAPSWPRSRVRRHLAMRVVPARGGDGARSGEVERVHARQALHGPRLCPVPAAEDAGWRIRPAGRGRRAARSRRENRRAADRSGAGRVGSPVHAACSCAVPAVPERFAVRRPILRRPPQASIRTCPVDSRRVNGALHARVHADILPGYVCGGAPSQARLPKPSDRRTA